MQSTFYSQLEPCFARRPSVPPSPGAKRHPAALPPSTTAANPAPDRMIEPKTQGDLLKALIVYARSEESHRLQNSLAKAECDGKCIQGAMFRMMGLFLLSGAGLCGCTVLLPRVLGDSADFVVRSLYALGFASLTCQVAFLGYLLWQRAFVGRLHTQCLRVVLALLESRPKEPAASISVI